MLKEELEKPSGVPWPLPVPVHSLSVKRKPKSGKPQELLDDEEISRTAIIKKVKELL